MSECSIERTTSEDKVIRTISKDKANRVTEIKADWTMGEDWSVMASPFISYIMVFLSYLSYLSFLYSTLHYINYSSIPLRCKIFSFCFYIDKTNS